MKKLLLFLMAIVTAVSCKTTGGDGAAIVASLTLTPSTVTFKQAGDSKIVNVITNQDVFTYEKQALDGVDTTWATIEKAGTKLKITVPDYLGETTRSMEVKIVAGEGDNTNEQYLIINQVGTAEATLIVPATSVQFEGKGENKEIIIVTNQIGLVTVTPGATWLQSEVKADTIILKTGWNDNPSGLRTTDVTIQAGVAPNFKKKTIPVSQLAPAAAELTLSKTDFRFSHLGETNKIVTATTNYAEYITATADDAAYSVTVTGTKISITAPENTGAEKTVTVTVKAGRAPMIATEEITILQEGAVIIDAGTQWLKATAAGAADFSETDIYTISDASGILHGIIVEEYINDAVVQDRMVVAYPCIDNKPVLSKGIALADGGTVVWNTAATEVVYTPGSGAVSTVYFYRGNILTTAPAASVNGSLAPMIITDIDGNTYGALKTCDIIWMNSNFKATKLTDGTALVALGGTTPGYYDTEVGLPGGGRGYLYNHWAIETGKLAPEGWAVYENAHIQKALVYCRLHGGGRNNLFDASFSSVGNSRGTWNITKLGFKSTGSHKDGGYEAGDAGCNMWNRSEAAAETGFFNHSAGWNGDDVSQFADQKRFGWGVRCIRTGEY